MTRPFQPSDYVRKSSNPGIAGSIVSGPIDDAGDLLWRVRMPDGNVRMWMDGTFELVPTRETIEDLLRKRMFGRKIDFSQLLTFHRLVKPLTNNIYSLHSNRIQFLPYQFKPLLKFIDSPSQRLLIADDVGLGKTIEAGLILSELKVRSSLQSVLVVCPAHLREKWRMEMLHRFGEDFKIMNSSDFRNYLNDYSASDGHMPVRAICSIQTLRSERLIEMLDRIDPRFDLVIVDEAHHMRNSSTRTYRVGELLSRQAEAVLLLTATPIQTQLENLFNLLRLLDRSHFENQFIFQQQLNANHCVLRAEAAISQVPPDLAALQEALTAIDALPEYQKRWYEENPIWPVIVENSKTLDAENRRQLARFRLDLGELNLLGDSLTRTRKADVLTDVARREAQVLKVTYTPEERNVYDFILSYVRSRYSHKGSFFEKAAMMTPHRRAASSLIGAARYYVHGKGRTDLDDYLASLDDGSNELPDEFGEDIDGAVNVFEQAARQNITDSKYEALLKFIRTLNRDEKLIIFSTFPSTLEYLRDRLVEESIESVIISGQVAVGDRTALVEQFRDQTSIRVLLSSEVGGEGLDLQFCGIIVNYDLPWNPMVVAQRIGRIDRIGQRFPVIRIVNFSVSDTIDEIILERLYARIGLFERSIGLTDGILGDVLEYLTDIILSGDLTDEARAETIELEALALEARIAILERMDDHSDRIFISDAFLQDEVTRANDLHRYISDQDVRTLVIEFLGKYYPKTILESITGRNLTYLIDADSSLKRAFQTFRLQPGERLPRFLSQGDTSQITFDVDTANRHSDLEHINVTHPLVRLVLDHYKESGCDFSRTSFFKLVSQSVHPGTYLVLIHKLVAAGVRARVQLISAVVRMPECEVLEEDESETLIAKMITRGVDMPHLARVPEDLPVMAAYQVADDIIAERYRIIRGELEKRDQAFRARRVASLRIHYNTRIARQRELATLHSHATKRDAARIKGFNTRATNLEQERDRRIEEIELGQRFDPEKEEVLGGVVEVHA